MKKEIQFGDKVRCKITGFIGIAVAKTEFINGCVQWNVLPKGDKNNKMPEDIGIDEQSLEIVPVKKKKIKKERTGGKMTRGLSQRGY